MKRLNKIFRVIFDVTSLLCIGIVIVLLSRALPILLCSEGDIDARITITYLLLVHISIVYFWFCRWKYGRIIVRGVVPLLCSFYSLGIVAAEYVKHLKHDDYDSTFLIIRCLIVILYNLPLITGLLYLLTMRNAKTADKMTHEHIS